MFTKLFDRMMAAADVNELEDVLYEAGKAWYEESTVTFADFRRLTSVYCMRKTLMKHQIELEA